MPNVRRRQSPGGRQEISQPSQPRQPARTPSRGSASCAALRRAACSNSAARAGLSVSELNAEITVETAIVRANCRKNCPMMPVMNAQGTNTALSTSAMAMTGPETSSMAWIVGVARRQAVLDVVLDRLDDDDGVVHDDADRQHQAEQRQVVEAEAAWPP